MRLPLDAADDVGKWVEDTATALCERDRPTGYELDGQALRNDLRARADDSRTRDPFYAFALYPEGFDSSLALLEIDLIHPDDTVPEITLGWLAETFSTHDFGAPRITHAELPIGPAVRIRQDFAAGDPLPDGPGVLLETVTYGIRPPGTESALMLLMSWSVPGIGDEMEDAADSIAQTLTVDA